MPETVTSPKIDERTSFKDFVKNHIFDLTAYAGLAVMLILVLPAFTDVYESLTGSLAASSYRYVYWAYAFCWIALAVMVLLSAALLMGLFLWRSGKRETVEKVLCLCPGSYILGEIVEGSEGVILA